MARHQRYLSAARRAVSAEFDMTYSFYSPEYAQEASEQLWEHFKIKARAVGNVVHYDSLDHESDLDDVWVFLDDLLAEEEEDAELAEDADEEDVDYDEIDPDAYDELSDYGDEDYDDSDVYMEPEVEEPPADYRPPAREPGAWMKSPYWADLAIDYSQLPDESSLQSRANTRRFKTTNTEELLDLAQQYAGSDDPAEQADLISIIFTLQNRRVDDWDLYDEYLRLYRWAQEGKGSAGLSLRASRSGKKRGRQVKLSRIVGLIADAEKRTKRNTTRKS